MRAECSFAAHQIVGDKERQEDAYAIVDLTDGRNERVLFVVADGMSGHDEAAEIARLAVRHVCGFIKTVQKPFGPKLAAALTASNNALAMAGVRDPKLAGAGCTLLLAVVEDDLLSWVSVGDCLLLLYRDRKLRRLNADHSMRSSQSNSGWITLGRARRHRPSQVLRSAVTGKPIPLVDISPEPVVLRSGDIIILATDGLEVLDSKAICRIVASTAHSGADVLVDRLLMGVIAKGARHLDNTTLLACRPLHSCVRQFRKENARFPADCG